VTDGYRLVKKDIKGKCYMEYKKGFTLIELVVVIAILTALAALALPNMTGIINTAKERVCISNRETLRRSYMANIATVQNKDSQAVTAAITEAVNDVHGSLTDSTHYTVSDTCHGGEAATITVIYNGDHSAITEMRCSVHREDLVGTSPAPVFLEAISALRTALGKDNFNADSATIGKKTNVTYINNYLENQGINISDYGFKCYSVRGNTEGKSTMVFTKVDLAGQDLVAAVKANPNMYVSVLKYDEKTNTYVAGYCKMSITTSKNENNENKSYVTIDPNSASSFVEYKGQTSETKSNFDATYNIYTDTNMEEILTSRPSNK
jgi:prepilin-type N-terminal cleavage/methylation domain-containing protein